MTNTNGNPIMKKHTPIRYNAIRLNTVSIKDCGEIVNLDIVYDPFYPIKEFLISFVGDYGLEDLVAINLFDVSSPHTSHPLNHVKRA